MQYRIRVTRRREGAAFPPPPEGGGLHAAISMTVLRRRDGERPPEPRSIRSARRDPREAGQVAVRSRPSWDPRAHRSGRCYPVLAPARAQLPAVSAHSDDPSVADHDPAPRVAFRPGYEIGLQLTTPAVRVPVPPKPADRGCGRLPQLLALVGCGHRGDKVDRPLAVKEVKRAHVDDHRPDQAARVMDRALEDRPHVDGTSVRLTLLAGQRVHRLPPDLRVLVIEGAGQRRCRLWREVDLVQ